MKHFRLLTAAALGSLALVSCAERPTVTAPSDLQPLAAAAPVSNGVNVLLKGPITEAIVADLGTIGPVLDQLPQINAVTMRATAAELPAIRAKPYVASAEVDGEAGRAPVATVDAPSDFSAGMSSWDQDAVGVTVSPGFTGRNPALDGLTGNGVYVVILDSGLLPTWREYFPTERIATQYARAFGGGGGDMGTISEQPDKWEGDTDSHGTHVTSTVIGYRHPAGDVNGTAPKSTVIPVKVLNQNGSGWWSVISRGIIYAAELKTGELAGHPVVVNMSIGGGRSAILERAIDFAIARGVIIVAAAGNAGTSGMHWPGAYAPVISVAAYGWTKQWLSCDGKEPIIRTWWRLCDVADPTSANDFFIAPFSSRERNDGRFPQQLDVSAPGFMVVGAYQVNQGQTNWFFLNGTSMASPHVAGIAALMAERKPSLTQAEAEAALKSTAIRMAAGSRVVFDINAERYVTVSWGTDATGRGMVDAAAAIKAVKGR